MLAAGLLFAAAIPATALTTAWASWEPISGSTNDYQTVLHTTTPGFPQAVVSSDSRGPVQIASGATVYLDLTTPPGAAYGSSRNSPYLVLRPRADTATAPSTTTYTFDTPTPDAGWAFVLGDIDADAVRVTALDATGTPVPSARVDTWFRGTFNYAGAADLPVWDATTSTLTGNPTSADTNGAAGWFEPDVPLSSLTMTFFRRAGFPVYQTWFVSRARPVSGAVTDVSPEDACDVGLTVLTLLTADGVPVATTQPAPDGSYSFGDVAMRSDYTVAVTAPEGCTAVGPTRLPVDNRGEDGDPGSIASFGIRLVVPYPISGTVRDGADNPVGGVEVTLTRPDGSVVTTTTSLDGTYLFDDNALSEEGYTISITVPTGYRAGPQGTEITGVIIDDAAITDQDFVVVALPAVSGRVTGGGDPLRGARVIMDPAGGGEPLGAVTDADGLYTIPRVPAGSYALQVDTPAGYQATPPRPVTVADADIVAADISLARLGTVLGTVTGEDDQPLAGVTIEVDGPDGAQTTVTDDSGSYILDGLTSGRYEISVVAPDGSEVLGSSSHVVTITEAGEVIEEQDFQLVPTQEPAPTPTPTEPPEPTPTPTPEDPGPSDGPSPTDPTTSPVAPVGRLPSTGVEIGVLLIAALGITTLGVALRWRASRRH